MNTSFSAIATDLLESVSGGQQADPMTLLRACAAGAHAQGMRERSRFEEPGTVGPLSGPGMTGCLQGMNDVLNPRIPTPGPAFP